MHIAAGARSSPLSRAQFREIEALFPQFQWEPVWMKTTGDLDKTTSLRSLDRTDFFTKELDAMLLQGVIRVAIHSAKDLPEPMPEGLVVAFLTEGIDPRDSLVLRDSVPSVVATSSERREALVHAVWPECRFVDLRGTIEERLSLLEPGHPQGVDGVVVAEAALIRLGLTDLKRHVFPEAISSLQGKLAIVARERDVEIRRLLKAL